MLRPPGAVDLARSMVHGMLPSRQIPVVLFVTARTQHTTRACTAVTRVNGPHIMLAVPHAAPKLVCTRLSATAMRGRSAALRSATDAKLELVELEYAAGLLCAVDVRGAERICITATVSSNRTQDLGLCVGSPPTQKR